MRHESEEEAGYSGEVIHARAAAAQYSGTAYRQNANRKRLYKRGVDKAYPQARNCSYPPKYVRPNKRWLTEVLVVVVESGGR